MGEQHRKGHKVFVSNISSNVSKLWRICGCVLAVVYSVWILSSFVTADKHTYGGIALKGLYLIFNVGNAISVENSMKIKHVVSL